MMTVQKGTTKSYNFPVKRNNTKDQRCHKKICIVVMDF